MLPRDGFFTCIAINKGIKYQNNQVEICNFKQRGEQNAH